MGLDSKKFVKFLVVDTTAFIQNASLQDVAENIITCSEVVNEITNKRQLKRLVVLPYDLVLKNVFPENIKIVTEFAKKTGDYASLSATDIKVIALTYQLEKEKNGINNLRTEPIMQKPIITTENKQVDMTADVTGFYLPQRKNDKNSGNLHNLEKSQDVPEIEILYKKIESLKNIKSLDESKVDATIIDSDQEEYEMDSDSENDDIGWITPTNFDVAKKQVNSEIMETKYVAVACMTTDFAMQNVLRQMNLNVSALDGRIIKQLRTYVLRCYSCFKTTSIMTKKFCPKCGNNTLKRVAISLDENGKMQIHINSKKPLTTKGKKFSMPRIKGGKHPNNPIIVEDQPMPQNRISNLARMKNNPLDDDYIAGFSPFVMRDVCSRSAQLNIRSGQGYKYWMQKNPNESHKKRK